MEGTGPSRQAHAQILRHGRARAIRGCPCTSYLPNTKAHDSGHIVHASTAHFTRGFAWRTRGASTDGVSPVRLATPLERNLGRESIVNGRLISRVPTNPRTASTLAYDWGLFFSPALTRRASGSLPRISRHFLRPTCTSTDEYMHDTMKRTAVASMPPVLTSTWLALWQFEALEPFLIPNPASNASLHRISTHRHPTLATYISLSNQVIWDDRRRSRSRSGRRPGCAAGGIRGEI